MRTLAWILCLGLSFLPLAGCENTTRTEGGKQSEADSTKQATKDARLSRPALVHPGPQNPDQKKSDNDLLQGKWLVTTMERNALKAPLELIEGATATFTTDKVVMHFPMAPNHDDANFKPESVFTLDASATPKIIDLTAQNGPNKGKTVKGIYSVEKAILSICIANDEDAPRPTEFTSPNGSGCTVFVLTKVAINQFVAGKGLDDGGKRQVKPENGDVAFKKFVGKPGDRVKTTKHEQVVITNDKILKIERIVVDVTEILEAGKDGEQPSKLKRVYERAETRIEGKTSKDPIEGKTVFIEKTGTKYTATFEGGEPVPGPLHAEFSGEVGPKGVIVDLLFPDNPVKPGVTWDVRSKFIDSFSEPLIFARDKMAGSVKLINIYMKDGRLFGVLEGRMQTQLPEFKGIAPDEFVEKGEFEIRRDGCIDGSAPDCTTVVILTNQYSFRGVGSKSVTNTTRKTELLSRQQKRSDAVRGSGAKPPDAGGDKGDNAEALFREMRTLVEEGRRAQARGDAKKVEKIKGLFAGRMARLSSRPAAEIELARSMLSLELFREIDRFSAAWMLGARPDLGPGMPQRLEPLWQSILDAQLKEGEAVGKPPTAESIPSWKVDLAAELTRQSHELVLDIVRLQGLLWGAEEVGVFRGDLTQKDFAGWQPYKEWCTTYRRNPPSAALAGATRDVASVKEISDRSSRRQATAEDRRELDILIRNLGGAESFQVTAADDKLGPLASRLLRKQHLLWESREDMRNLHDRVSKMPGYTGKIGKAKD